MHSRQSRPLVGAVNKVAAYDRADRCGDKYITIRDAISHDVSGVKLLYLDFVQLCW